MIDFLTIKKSVSIFLLATFLASQVFMLSVFLMPKPAEAGFQDFMKGIGSAVKQAISVPEWNWYEVLKDIAIGALRGAAARASERFLTDFINKTTEKYKIRNYLYYDRVLSQYYLNRYLQDKISDPDLRAIYSLMERSFITGEPTGTTGGQDPRRALIPGLKRAISKYYVDHGGVDRNKVFYPTPGTDDLEYFRTARAYFTNPEEFTETHLQAEFGEFQSSATTAAQLEILVGNGLKAGRILGGTCSVTTRKAPADPDPNLSPEGCRKAGGTWRASALDQARSFIDNPTHYIQGRLDAAIKTHMDKNFDPNNFWVEIGGHIGNFLVNQLGLKESGGTLPDDPRGYNPLGDVDYTSNPSTDIDFDGDGIADGADYDADGDIDACYFSGTAPDCTGSIEVLGGGGEGGGPCAESLPNPQQFVGALRAAIDKVNTDNPNGIADAFNTVENQRTYFNIVADILRAGGLNASLDVLNGNGNPNTGDLIAIWNTGDTHAERYDVVISGGGNDRPMRQAATAQDVGYVPVAECIP